VNILGPLYVSDIDTKWEIKRMFCKCVVCDFPMLQSAPTMETDRPITHTCNHSYKKRISERQVIRKRSREIYFLKEASRSCTYL